ncbi:MAG: exodeoxyribonuclease VII small subunit [Thermoguttaceae bacterium]
MEDSSEEKNAPKTLSFEEAYRQIEKIVATLESGQGELEESLENYEKAVRLVRLCRSKLDAATQRIEMLKGLDAEGQPELEQLDETSLRSKSDAAGRQSSSENPENEDDSEPKFDRRTKSKSTKDSKATRPKNFLDPDSKPPF